jgi:hypothetical protein
MLKVKNNYRKIDDLFHCYYEILIWRFQKDKDRQESDTLISNIKNKNNLKKIFHLLVIVKKKKK